MPPPQAAGRLRAHAPSPARADATGAFAERPEPTADLSQQLDRWADEGGAIGPMSGQPSMIGQGVNAMLATEIESAGLKAVRALERRRIEATRANDIDALAGLFHDDLIYINSAGEIYDKDRYLHDIGTHALTYDRDFDVRETHVRSLDDLVILAGIMLGHSHLDGEQQVFHFPCIGVWRKEDGEWRMIAWQSSSGNR